MTDLSCFIAVELDYFLGHWSFTEILNMHSHGSTFSRHSLLSNWPCVSQYVGHNRTAKPINTNKLIISSIPSSVAEHQELKRAAEWTTEKKTSTSQNRYVLLVTRRVLRGTPNRNIAKAQWNISWPFWKYILSWNSHSRRRRPQFSRQQSAFCYWSCTIVNGLLGTTFRV